MKRGLSLVLFIIMLLTSGAVTVSAQTNEDTVISEDFGSGFVIDSEKGTVSTNSGFTVTTGDNMFTTDKTVISQSDGALYINARQAGVSKVDMNFNLPGTTEDKIYLSYDLKVSAWGTANFMTGQDIFSIKDSSGNTALGLYLDGTAASGDKGYYIKTKNIKSNAADEYTIGTFEKNGTGMSSFVKIEYVIDVKNKTYKVFLDGQGKEFDFETSVTDISCITFPNSHTTAQWYNKNYTIDNLYLIINSGKEEKTVNFYQNGELYESETVEFGNSADFPVFEAPEGMYFSGWYGDANGETPVDLSVITEDINAYAVYKPYVIREDFGKTTSFVINKDNKTIKTDSGFTFSANDTQYDVMNVLGGALSTNGKGMTTSNNLYIGFDAITEGKAELSFKFSVTGHNGNGNPCAFGIIENNTEGLYAAYQKVGFGTVTDVINNTDAPNTLTKDNDWHKVTYKLDLDNSSYHIVFDGTSYGPYTLGNDSVSRICFNGMSHQASNFNYDLKDICLILNPDENIKSHTVTYVNGGNVIGTETVKTGESAANIPDLTGGDKVFSAWYSDENCTKAANLDCVISDTTVYAGFIEETAYIPERKAVKIGEVQTIAVEETFAEGKMAAATFNGNKLLYGIDSTGNLYVYNVTVPAKASKIGTYEYALTSGQGLIVCGNYLIAANGYAIRVIALDETGLPTGIKETLNLGATVKKLEPVGDLLFIHAGSKVEVYDTSKLDEGLKKVITVINSGVYSFSASKISDIRHRVYAMGNADYTKEDGTTDKTMTLMIYDVTNTPMGYTSVKLFEGIPDYSAVNAWPCYGIYGEDETVSGWIEYSACDSGYVNYTGKDTVRMTCYVSPTGAVRNDDFIIDTSNPKAPKVISVRENTVYECAPLSLRIDDALCVEVPRMMVETGATAYLYDYSRKDYIRTNAKIEGIYGKSVAVSDGAGYVAGDDGIYVLDLYNADGSFSVSDLYLTDKTGNMGTEVRSGIISGKSYIYNPGAERQVVMVAALYGLFDNSVKDTRVYNYTLKTGFNEIENTVDLNSLAHYGAYTTYLRMYLWDGMNTVKPITESAKSDAVTATGIEFDIWISDETETAEGILLMDRHGGGLTWKEYEPLRKFCAENNWAIMSFEDGEAQVLTKFEDADRAGNLIYNQIDAYAKSTGHSELSNVPIATFGHSAATTFAERFAVWAEDRCFAAVGFRVHDDYVFDRELLTVPFMVNQGETDAYADNGGQLALSQSFNAKGGLVNYVLDPECSHGMNDYKSFSIIMPFLEEAYAARVPKGVDFKTTKPSLNIIDRTTGWLGDISNCEEYIMASKPNGERGEYGVVVEEVKEYEIRPYSEGDSSKDSWLFNEDYANKWYEFSMTGVVSEIEYR